MNSMNLLYCMIAFIKHMQANLSRADFDKISYLQNFTIYKYGVTTGKLGHELASMLASGSQGIPSDLQRCP